MNSDYEANPRLEIQFLLKGDLITNVTRTNRYSVKTKIKKHTEKKDLPTS